MKHIPKSVLVLALLCATQLLTTQALTAQCTPFFDLETFDDPNSFEWGVICTEAPNKSCASGDYSAFHLTTDLSAEMEGPNFLKAEKRHQNKNFMIEKCFDLSSLSAAQISFTYFAESVGKLELLYSIDGSNFMSIWTNTIIAQNKEMQIPLDFTLTNSVTLRFVANELNVRLDAIKVYDPPKSLCFSYDLAGNRIGAELIVGLVGDEEVVASIGQVFDTVLPSALASSTDAELSTVTDNGSLDPLEFNVFPNPTNNTLNISSSGNESYQLELYDTNGKKLREDTKSGTHKMNVSDLMSGTYYLLIRAGDQHLNYRIMKI